MKRHPSLLTSAGVVAFAASIILACSTNISSAPQPDAGGDDDDDSGTPVSGDSGSTPGKDSGGTTADTGAGGDGASACMLPDAWTYNPMCDTCQVKYCCAPINDCASDPGCLAIFNCEQNCYNGQGPDGGAINPDAGPDDAGNTPTDDCIAACKAAGTAAAQMLFDTQDTCVNVTSCMTACM